MAFQPTTPSARQRNTAGVQGSNNNAYNPGNYQPYQGNPSSNAPSGGPSGYDSSIYPGPYGQPNVKNQQPFNDDFYSQTNSANPYQQPWDDALAKYNSRNWGDWSNDKVAAGNVAYSQAMAPWLQGQQNARTQAFNETSWAANFAEQQYLNKNTTALDWAANNREDAGLNYAITSGNRDFEASQAQQKVANQQGQYGLDTQRYEQQANANYQQGSLANDRTQISNEYNIAKQQNSIDQMYKSGLISVQQKEAMTNELKVKNDFSLGQQANANNKWATDVEREIGLGANANDKYSIDVQKQLGMAQNENERQKILNDYSIAQKSNAIEEQYKQGLISVQQRDAATNELRAQNEFTLGQGQLGLGQQQLQLDSLVRTGQLSNEQYQAQTARLQQQSQESQWQNQLMTQQQQFGQQLQFDREKMRNEAIQSRYNVSGRARNPNMAAWNAQWA